MHKQNNLNSGFTIVELLIVIVVIAILAAISVATYTGIQGRANQAGILSEVNQWKKAFEMYKAANGTYPSPVASGDPTISGGPGTSALNGYCLGTGFPQSSGVSFCGAVSSSSVHRIAESTGTHLLTQLSTIATIPSNSRKHVYNNTTGPSLRYYDANDLSIFAIFAGGTDCSSLGMSTGYGDAGRQDCYYSLR